MNKKERIKKIEKELFELKKEVANEEPWEPQGGERYVNSNGEIDMSRSTDHSRIFGLERPTEEQAKKAAKAMRIHNRLLAYVDEFDPHWKADWDDNTQAKFYVYKDIDEEQWCKQWCVGCNTSIYYPGFVFMSKECAEGLVEKLNSGEVVL